MMLPTEEAIWVGEELTRRFGVPRWLFTLSATDANRTALRLARQLTRRPKVLVYSYCYHGSVDEAFAVEEGGVTVAREGNVGAPVDVGDTTIAIEFNDVRRPGAGARDRRGRRRPRRAGDDEHGDHPARRRLHDRAARADARARHAADHRRDPHVLGRSRRLHAGVGPRSRHPRHRQGDRRRRAVRRARPDRRSSSTALFADEDADYEDTGGVGGTLAGNALSSAAMRATLEHTLHADAFSQMIPLATRFAEGVQGVIDAHGVPWNVTQLGCRAEYQFLPEPARNGTVAAASHDEDLEHFLHLHALNRGVMLTPFHNMALMCPHSTAGRRGPSHRGVRRGGVGARERPPVGLRDHPRASHRRPRPPHRRRPRLGHRPLQLPLPVLHARRGPAVAGARRRS